MRGRLQTSTGSEYQLPHGSRHRSRDHTHSLTVALKLLIDHLAN